MSYTTTHKPPKYLIIKQAWPTSDHRKLTDVRNMTRKEVVPYYRCLILSEADNGEVIRINQLILSKWTSAGLLYIKNKAWRGIDLL